jgi:hypothetical protein
LLLHVAALPQHASFDEQGTLLISKDHGPTAIKLTEVGEVRLEQSTQGLSDGRNYYHYSVRMVRGAFMDTISCEMFDSPPQNIASNMERLLELARPSQP